MNMFGNGKASIWSTQIHEFGSTSVGVRAMFELIISLMKMFLFAIVFAIPASFIYLQGSGSEYVWDFTGFSGISAANSGLAESTTVQTFVNGNGTETIEQTTNAANIQFGSLVGFTARQASELVSAFDWISSVCMFLYLIYIRHSLLKIAKEVHLETAQASSYTVELGVGLPNDVTEKELIDHFNRLYALNQIDCKGRKKVKKVTLYHERAKHEAAFQKKNHNKTNTTNFTVSAATTNDGTINASTSTVPAVTLYNAQGQKWEINVDEKSIEHPLNVDFGEDETPITNLTHQIKPDETYLGGWVADVVLIRDEGDIIRHYQHLAKLDSQVRHQRACVKRVSPGTAYEKGPDEKKAEKLMNKLMKLEFQQQQGLLLFQDPGPGTLPVIKAFVTFNHEESYQRCVNDYDEAWRRARCCPCCPGHRSLRFRYTNILKVTPAPEPSDILHENQGEYVHQCAHRWRYWSSLLVVVAVLFMSLGLIFTIHIVGGMQTESSSESTEQLCGSSLPKALSTSIPVTTAFQYMRGDEAQDTICQQKINALDAKYLTIQGRSISSYNISVCTSSYHSCTLDERISNQQLCPCFRPNPTDDNHVYCTKIDKNGIESTSITKSKDLAVCYCIQKLNKLNQEYNSAIAISKLDESDSDVCSNWLNSEATAAGWKAAASFVIAIVNGLLGVTIAAKSKSSRPNSISMQNSEIFIIYFIAQFFNSVLLTIFINAEIVIPGIEPWGDHADFTRAWFTSAGASLTSTMVLLAFSSHLYPIFKCLKFLSKRKKLLKKASKFVSQSELNEKCIGPDYHLEYRLTGVMIPVSTAILFGTFLPMLYLVALFALIIIFWVDKSLIVKYHKRPPNLDASIPVYATDALIGMVLLRIALSSWIFGIESIFVSEGSQLEIQGYTPDLLGRFGKRTAMPHLILLIFIIALLISRRILQFTLGSVLETLEYWLIPADCCGRDPLKRNQEEHDTHKPPFSEIFGTIIKPLTMGWGRTSAQAITHKVPERHMALKGWCHVCVMGVGYGGRGTMAPCTNPHCTEWHKRQKMWLSDGVVQGIPHKKGDYARTWEVIRVHSLHSYRIQNNERYVHVNHLRDEERFVDDEEN